MQFHENQITGIKSDHDEKKKKKEKCVCLYKGQVDWKIQGNKVSLEGVT